MSPHPLSLPLLCLPRSPLPSPTSTCSTCSHFAVHSHCRPAQWPDTWQCDGCDRGQKHDLTRLHEVQWAPCLQLHDTISENPFSLTALNTFINSGLVRTTKPILPDPGPTPLTHPLSPLTITPSIQTSTCSLPAHSPSTPTPPSTIQPSYAPPTVGWSQLSPASASDTFSNSSAPTSHTVYSNKMLPTSSHD
jgi:hypothetical protein